MFTALIPVAPVAWGRARVGRFGHFTPIKTRVYEETITREVRRAYRDGKPVEGPLALTIVFYVKRPARTKNKWPSVRPDLDNYLKAVLDACNGVLWKDDAQLVRIHAEKRYAERWNLPGVWMKMQPIAGVGEPENEERTKE